MIVLEQPTQPLPTADLPVRRGFGEYSSRKQELIAFALMIPLFVIMQDEIANGFSERGLAKKDQVIQTRLFDGAHKALCVSVYMSAQMYPSEQGQSCQEPRKDEGVTGWLPPRQTV